MEVDGVAKEDYSKVVDKCYLCDMCYMSKCPYVPPTNGMLTSSPHAEGKSDHFKKGDTKFRDNIITSTDMIGKVASMPVVNTLVNVGNKTAPVRALLDKALGIHKDAKLPPYTTKPSRKTHGARIFDPKKSQRPQRKRQKIKLRKEPSTSALRCSQPATAITTSRRLQIASLKY